MFRARLSTNCFESGALSRQRWLFGLRACLATRRRSGSMLRSQSIFGIPRDLSRKASIRSSPSPQRRNQPTTWIQEKRARANMDLHNNEKISRRKFVKGAAGAAVCCACYSSDCLAASKENSEQDGKGKEHLAAACGTYCGACPAYIAKHSEDMQMKMKLQKRSSSGLTKALS